MLALTRERKRQGLTKSALARELAMSASTIGEIENGYRKPYPKQKEKLTAFFGYMNNPDALFREVSE
jgi:transcriptional regulator with XRE-family HTH domain